MGSPQALLFSLDSEESCLGAMMIDPDAARDVFQVVQPKDFGREKNRWIAEVCLELVHRGKPTNQVLIAHELARRGRLEPLGGVAYIGHLVGNCPSSVHAVYYAELVRECSLRRGQVERGKQIQKEGLSLESTMRLDGKRGGIEI